jgi:hypothetical protein
MLVNAFSTGSMFITPVLRSLAVKSNTVNEVEVTNNNAVPIEIEAATHMRLYDDDDMDNTSPTNAGSLRNGDENEDVPEANMDLLQADDTPCVVNPVNGQITNNCNVLMPAYIRRSETFLTGSNENIPYSTNSTDVNILNIYANHFQNIMTEASSDFWTVYIVGCYQWIFPTTNSSADWDADPDVHPTMPGVGNSFAFGKVDDLNGIGVTIFIELNRAKEQENINIFNALHNPTVATWQNRPIGAKYTVAHELGHLF